MESDLFSPEIPEESEIGLRHLQSRYVVPYVACVLAAVLITGLVMGLKGRALLVDRVKSEQLTVARAGAQALGAIADSALRFAESVSQSGLAKSGDAGTIKILIRSQIEHTGAISNLFLFSNNSTLIASSQESSPMFRSLPEDPCFNKVREGAANCFTGVMRLEGGDRRAYVYTPVYGGSGSASRILVAEINLEDKGFNSIVLGLNPGEKGFSYLVDGEGKLVVSGDPARDNTIRDVSKFEPVKAVLGGKFGSMEYSHDRKSMMASFYRVEPMGWGLIVQRPAGEVDNGVGLLFKLLVVFMVVACGGAAALAVFQAQAVTRFLFFLSTRMDAVARGHSHVEIASGEGVGFSPLISSFNHMVAAIEDRQKDGVKTLDNVRETARYNQGVLSSIKDLFMVVDPWLAVVTANEKAESYMPAGMLPCVGKGLGSLGPAWGQGRLADAAKKAIESVQVVSVSTVRFPPVEKNDAAIYDFRIYPLTTGTGGAVFYGREVSEFVSRHEKVRESEAFYRAAAAGAGDAMLVLDQAYKVEWLNPAAATLLGVQDDFVESDWLACLDAKHHSQFADALRTTAEAESPFPPMEAELTVNGRKLHVEIVAGVMHLGAGAVKTVVTMRPVDSRRTLEQSAFLDKPILEKKIKFLAAVFEAAPDEIAVVNDQGLILMVNSAFARRFDEQKEVFAGKRFDLLCAGGGPVIELSHLDKAGAARRELMMRNLRGKTFHAEVYGAAVKDANGNKAYVFSIREIGSEREAQAMEARKLEARTRIRMARTIADRFDSILETLTSEVRALGENLFAPETRAIWDNILKSCKDLSLAANSLTMYSMDSPVQLSACRVEDILKDTLGTLTAKGMVPADVQIDAQPDKFCPPLNADADLVKMVVWHLALNAIQAAAANEDGGEVLVRSYQADVDGAAVVIFEVLDNGPEYDPVETTHFFEPFYGTKPGCMGLGLTLSRRVVLKHNGRIGIERSKGITRASFFIPLDLTRANLPRM